MLANPLLSGPPILSAGEETIRSPCRLFLPSPASSRGVQPGARRNSFTRARIRTKRTLGTAASANWKAIRRAWRTTRPPISDKSRVPDLISLSCRLRKDQSFTASGRPGGRRKFPKLAKCYGKYAGRKSRSRTADKCGAFGWFTAKRWQESRVQFRSKTSPLKRRSD